MSDIGSELRWILLTFSIVLIGGLYLVGRWGRRQSVATDVSRRSQGDRHFEQDISEREVPRLDDAVVVRERHVEPRLMIIPDDQDGLPNVRIDSHAVDHTLSAMQSDDPDTGDSFEFGSILADDRHEYGQEPSFDDAVQRGVGPDSAELPSEPSITKEPAFAAHSPSTSSPAPTAQHVTPKKAASRKIVALRLVAGAQRYDGTRLKDAFENAKLRHGKYGIYHRHDEQEVTVFSVASMVEPGTFDPATMANMQFNGVMLFAQLPGPMDGVLMFEQMFECAEQLAGTLGGTVQDERGTALTPPRTERIRDDIENFQHLVGIDASLARASMNEGMSAP